MLRWPQLDTLWNTLRQKDAAGWYVYAVGEAPPNRLTNPAEFNTFLTEIDILLRKEHNEDYCGIVYADSPDSPRMVKIYDPGNLGATCGFSESPPLPGWVISLDPPCDLPALVTPPANRRRWWEKIWRK